MTTKLELQQQLAARNAEVERLRLRVTVLEADNALLRSKVERSQPIAKVIHEFDPDVPGDYTRAADEARQHGGIVRRVTHANPQR